MKDHLLTAEILMTLPVATCTASQRHTASCVSKTDGMSGGEADAIGFVDSRGRTHEAQRSTVSVRRHVTGSDLKSAVWQVAFVTPTGVRDVCTVEADSETFPQLVVASHNHRQPAKPGDGDSFAAARDAALMIAGNDPQLRLLVDVADGILAEPSRNSYQIGLLPSSPATGRTRPLPVGLLDQLGTLLPSGHPGVEQLHREATTHERHANPPGSQAAAGSTSKPEQRDSLLAGAVAAVAFIAGGLYLAAVVSGNVDDFSDKTVDIVTSVPAISRPSQVIADVQPDGSLAVDQVIERTNTPAQRVVTTCEIDDVMQPWNLSPECSEAFDSRLDVRPIERWYPLLALLGGITLFVAGMSTAGRVIQLTRKRVTAN